MLSVKQIRYIQKMPITETMSGEHRSQCSCANADLFTGEQAQRRCLRNSQSPYKKRPNTVVLRIKYSAVLNHSEIFFNLGGVMFLKLLPHFPINAPLLNA